jgi:predicted ATPase
LSTEFLTNQVGSSSEKIRDSGTSEENLGICAPGGICCSQERTRILQELEDRFLQRVLLIVLKGFRLEVCRVGPSAERKLTEELLVLAEEKHTPFFAALGTMQRGVVLAVTEDAEAAVPMIDAGMSRYRSMNSTWLTPWYLTRLAEAQAKLGHYDEAWQRIFEAFEEMEKGGEVQHQAEINRVAGKIALLSPEIDVAKAEGYFERALAVACQQQAKSWELRASMSLARLWRDQGKVQQARELLAPVYGWFSEGFDTLDLKEAKALHGELRA